MPPERTLLILAKHSFKNFSAQVRFTHPRTLTPAPPSPLWWIKLFPSPFRPQSGAVHFGPKPLSTAVYPRFIYNGGRLTRNR